MPSQKNQRKKNRRFEQKRNEISYEARFELVRKIAEKWGKELKVNRTGPTDGGAEQFTILLAFGDIPYIVLGAKGVGRSAIEADSNSAWNLLSFFQGFLSRSTMQTLRKKWAAAETEIGEIVQICRLIEDAVNTEQYNQLRTVPILDANPPEKSWARQLRLELRSLYAKKQLQSMAGKTTSQAATSTIFTQQAQLKTLKRKLSTVASDADSGVPVTKKNKACQAEGNGYIETDWADEYDEDGLHFTYISPLSTSNSSSPSTLCLDDDDNDIENACQASTSVTSSKVEDSKPSLNISSTSAASVVNSSVRNGVSELISRDLTSPSRFEQDLIGVHFNPAAAPLPNLIRQYRLKKSINGKWKFEISSWPSFDRLFLTKPSSCLL